MKKILIVGTGYVGLTTGLALAEKGNKITFLDLDETKIKVLSNGKAPIFEKDIEKMLIKNKEQIEFTLDNSVYNDHNLIFVCVPTPESSDGTTNLSFINSVLDNLKEKRTSNEKFYFITKSTVPVGTNKLIQNTIDQKEMNGEVVSNPEFLSQGRAVRDSLNPNRIIIGSKNKEAGEEVSKIFKNFNSKIKMMSLESAELVKYSSNAFLALKISFANEIANIAEAVGSDANDVLESVGLDPIIGKEFLGAGIGYGGSCFPKDTISLVKQGEKIGVDTKIAKAIIETNKKQIQKFGEEALKQKGKFGILGLSFKPGTDDTREAPAYYIIKNMNQKGIIPFVYDPQASNNFKKMFPEIQLEVVNSAKELIKKTNNILLVTEWDEFKSLKKEHFQNKKVFDGRRIYDFAFYQIGRGYLEENKI